MIEIARCGHMSIVLYHLLAFCRRGWRKPSCTLTDLSREETAMPLLVEIPDGLDLEEERLTAALIAFTQETVRVVRKRDMSRCKVLADISVSSKNTERAALVAQDFGLVIPSVSDVTDEFCLNKDEEVIYTDTLGMLQLS